MEVNKIDESKYQIRDILLAQKSEDKTRMLFERFHSELSIEFKKVGYSFHSRTHIRGVTYFANEKKAFLGLNIQQSFLSLLFFTGKYQVIGLQKSNWMRSGDNNGSKMFKVNGDSSIHEAVRASILCYRIAAAWPFPVEGVLNGITTEKD
jgi:hypothetical protein